MSTPASRPDSRATPGSSVADYDYPRPAAELSLTGKYLSLALTLGVHLLLLAFLFFGIRWSTKLNDVVEVELVRAVPQQPQQAQQTAKPVAKPQPIPAPQPSPPPPPPPPQASKPAQVKPDIALKEEKKKEPPKPAAAKRPPAPDPLKQQLEQELRDLRRQREAAAAAEAIKQEMAEVEARKQAAVASNRAMADYISRIRGRIKSNIILPAGIVGNPEAIFTVVQFPSGEILEVRLKKSSGHAGYDAAVERAIHKASPLPKPERDELFARNLELRFRPLED